jgi:hypothetical protein
MGIYLSSHILRTCVPTSHIPIYGYIGTTHLRLWVYTCLVMYCAHVYRLVIYRYMGVLVPLTCVAAGGGRTAWARRLREAQAAALRGVLAWYRTGPRAAPRGG